MIQPLSPFSSVTSENRPLKTYPAFTSCNGILCKGFQHCCRATSFKGLTNVFVVSAFSNASKFAATSLAGHGTRSVCKAISLQYTVVLEPSLTRNGSLVGTRANISETALLNIVFVLCGFCFLLRLLTSRADRASSRANVRCCKVL